MYIVPNETETKPLSLIKGKDDKSTYNIIAIIIVRTRMTFLIIVIYIAQ